MLLRGSCFGKRGEDSYLPRKAMALKSKFPSHVAYTSTPFQPAALLSMAGSYNALLDSGCTHHIIRDRSLFNDFSPRTISVGTANCGSLDALGTGDVKFEFPFGNRLIIFTLRGCLYAPSAPINLLSVGALVERGMSCLFSPGGITKVFFPDDHPKFAGVTFPAAVSNRLSFLRLSFLPPAGSSVLAMPAQVLPGAVVSSFITGCSCFDWSFSLFPSHQNGFHALAPPFWSYWNGRYACRPFEKLCYGC